MNVKSARAVMEFIRVINRDQYERVSEAIVPGHEARHYCVKITRKNDKLFMSCRRLAKWQEVAQPCEGNSSGYICYHCLALLLFAGEGNKIDLFETGVEAKATGRRVVEVQSTQGNGVVWAAFD